MRRQVSWLGSQLQTPEDAVALPLCPPGPQGEAPSLPGWPWDGLASWELCRALCHPQRPSWPHLVGQGHSVAGACGLVRVESGDKHPSRLLAHLQTPRDPSCLSLEPQPSPTDLAVP